ncbi:hypothetical protein CO051_06505 [Candidatus Roizmanbacteria bacterium CG_4_9_14_0_2_um_filter_39_13]|uniref:DUF2130 domain-containing protein n=1 Tax=Candidatus Roizmanbacteria bacterium CG_4_9_14_0_2_um_filter_39_13 TaxID=1974839 RepID=A0A2M8EWP0_9BACT|nr:MAG: hypothetical protein CO051_06505 [Candidatus Roizmanbacteria bacterium CG_4_9_14_0_2_um_filter_39_13]
MNNTKQKIQCPKCGESISIDDVLTHQIEEKIKKDFEIKQKIKEAELEQKEADLKKQADTLATSKKEIDSVVAKQVNDKMSEERLKLYKDAKTEAEKEQSAKTALLEEQLKNKEEKLAQATKNEIELRKEKIKLNEEKQAFELEKMRQLEEAKKTIVEEANKKATEEQQYVIAQLKKQLTDATKAKDDLARKLEQGSQQTQGEVLELELEEILKAEFPQDEIVPVPKGVKGADVIHKIIDRSGRLCGQIIWESKKTKAWSEGWIQKLKDDQRAIKADLAVIVSIVLPTEVKGFSLRDGVFVCDVKLAVNLASLLRYDLLKVSEANRALTGKEEKRDVVYAYVNSVDFKQRIQTIAEAFIEMKNDIDKEKRSYQAIWAKREKQVQRVIDNTFGIYGDLKGLTGGAIQEIKMLELEDGNNTELL